MEKEEILDDGIREAIFYHNGIRWFDFPVISRSAIVLAIFSFLLTFSLFGFAVSVVLLVFGFYYHINYWRTTKSSYNIFSTTIEIFNEYKPDEKYIVEMDNIEKVKFYNLSINGDNVKIDIFLKNRYLFEGRHELKVPIKLEIKSTTSQEELVTLFKVFEDMGIPIF